MGSVQRIAVAGSVVEQTTALAGFGLAPSLKSKLASKVLEAI